VKGGDKSTNNSSSRWEGIVIQIQEQPMEITLLQTHKRDNGQLRYEGNEYSSCEISW